MSKLINKNAERLNPCLTEQEQSYKCLDKNGFDHAKCEEYFENYNTCKKFWGKVYKDRKAKGIQPYLPEVEERKEIKAAYFKAVKGE
ncbi:coiled-coil-helix-coiled-coil-helix domain-containing protein 7 [Bombyx mandarina]|uniref:Coiled-coil-helix-coiled-coil-helix domain-containing protein 7 n=2 Tax=Bombyx TaxID=7090 RepID=A0A8R2AGG1_BOMMO|nr:coiled-coil-helix-coiled-coil-helix domain-containing protein 7 [Bombyx mori]XP_028029490.1 coiled-coil-helix-coiled-coil-helix domain-containing protein 7 [Bombyx mandarina]